MSDEYMYKVLLGPHSSEKATIVSDGNSRYVFRVTGDATKPQIKKAIKALFEVKVASVRTLNYTGKTKRTVHGIGKLSDVKKAYVCLADGQKIDFMVAE